MIAEQKTLGQAIDEIVAALSPLDEKARSTAISAACAHLGVHRPTGHPGLPPGQGQSPGTLPMPCMHDVRTLFGTIDRADLGLSQTPF